jgi:hypothetical protein
MTSSKKKKWKIFEKFVKRIYDISLSEYRVKVDHDIKLKGKSKQPHQIDVLITANIPLMTIRDIIDCKHWKTKVKKANVAELDSIKNDVNANRATIVSRKGFQKGAITYARSNGISLYWIRTPKEMGVHTMIIETKGMSNEIVSVEVRLESKNQEKSNKDFTKEHKKKNYEEANIYNTKDEIVANVFDLIDDSFKTLQKRPEAGLVTCTKFRNNHMIIKGKKERVLFVRIHTQKRFIDAKKMKPVEKTMLFINDVVNDKMIPVYKPAGFDELDK